MSEVRKDILDHGAQRRLTAGRYPLWLAAHEAGHAVAHHVLDELPPYPGPFIQSVSIIPDEDSLGRVEVQPRMHPDIQSLEELRKIGARDLPAFPQFVSNTVTAARYDIVELLAGPIAELYCHGGWLAPLLARDSIIKAILSGEGSEISDQRRVWHRIDWLTVPDPVPLLAELFDITRSLVATEWAGIARVARVLQAEKTMTGDGFETAWRSMRAAEAPRRAERRLGTDTVRWRDRLAAMGGAP